jgi:hypothetical protein
MAHLGLPELLILPFVLIGAAIPIASFVLIYLTYRKVTAIEQRLRPNL